MAEIRLHLKKRLETVITPFAAITGMLEAAEGNCRVEQVNVAIQVDLTGADAASDRGRLLD